MNKNILYPMGTVFIIALISETLLVFIFQEQTKVSFFGWELRIGFALLALKARYSHDNWTESKNNSYILKKIRWMRHLLTIIFFGIN